MSNTNDREAWLTQAALVIEDTILADAGVNLPEHWKVSVGWPHGSARAIGQAFDKQSSSDSKTFNMFISPILGSGDKLKLLATLLHEEIHLCVGIDQKHGGEFKRVARLVGLEGRLTATYAQEGSPAEALLGVYSEVESSLGDYPHSEIIPVLKVKKERAKNYATYVSTEHEGYEVKIKKELVELFGVPKDPSGAEMELKEE